MNDVLRHFPDVIYFIKRVNSELIDRYKGICLDDPLHMKFNGKFLSLFRISDKILPDMDYLECIGIDLIGNYYFEYDDTYLDFEYLSFSHLNVSIFGDIQDEHCFHDRKHKTKGIFINESLYVYNKKDLDKVIELLFKFVDLWFYNDLK